MTSPTPTTTPAPLPTPAPRPGTWFYVALATPLIVLMWAYWPNLGEMANAWANRAQYSHGYLVPAFAALLLWLRREQLDLRSMRPTLWGAAVLLVAVAMRAYGTYKHRVWLDSVSLLPALAALTMLFGGWSALRWAWPSILFLFFMIPLPFSVANSMSGPLQLLATECSTFLLQTFGLPALAEGTTIRINDATIGIVEACSGLKMLVVFFALSTGMVMVIKAPLPDKLFVVASSIPIALAANIIRITITGVMHELVNGEAANVFFHDVAGWFMMPLALGMMWVELKVLEKLFVPVARGIAPPPRGRSQPTAPPRVRQGRTPFSRTRAAEANESTQQATA
jgi:exosortase